jgi:voltage-gated potassium channel
LICPDAEDPFTRGLLLAPGTTPLSTKKDYLHVHMNRSIAFSFVERHLRAWELTMAGLTILSVATGILASQLGEPEILVGAEWALTIVFVAEYSFRLWAAPNRARYFKSALLDLVSLIPPVRGARLLRLVRLLRVASALNFALGTTQLRTQTKVILRIAVLWIVVVVISALGMYLAESGSNPNVTSLWDAIWWAVVTITTVGYGDVSPATSEGRIAAGVLMVLGITFFSFLTASITAALASSTNSENLGATERLKTAEDLLRKNQISEDEYSSIRKKILSEV